MAGDFGFWLVPAEIFGNIGKGREKAMRLDL